MLETRVTALLKKLESSSSSRGGQSKLKPLRNAATATARGAAQGARQPRSSRGGGSSAHAARDGGGLDDPPSSSARE